MGRAHRLVVSAGVEEGHDVAFDDRREVVVLGEQVARLVDVAGDRHPPGPVGVRRAADDQLLRVPVDEV